MICAIGFLIVVGAIVLFLIVSRTDARWRRTSQAEIDDDGERARAWIVKVTHHRKRVETALILYSPEDVPSSTMRELVNCVHRLTTHKPRGFAEARVADYVRDHMPSFGGIRLKIPRELTDDAEVYALWWFLTPVDKKRLDDEDFDDDWVSIRVMWDEHPGIVVAEPRRSRRSRDDEEDRY
ncbi:hypothetical protein [Limnoglobus roseus]|uniref:Uncharacterized protein n=1 Tax=Limnoglobus roseus TaxID=2598579 RepID=A0A5C1APF7_9BACT|nr:hypothetical protein [Limnoglobus roseus]QEL19632.1 hypothetical protein PX52LOC_06708 [Limnoglobus roseus]